MYRLCLSRQARRALAWDLTPPTALACRQFVTSQIARDPHAAGSPLLGPLDGLHAAVRGQVRVVYRIQDDDDSVVVILIQPRYWAAPRP